MEGGQRKGKLLCLILHRLVSQNKQTKLSCCTSLLCIVVDKVHGCGCCHGFGFYWLWCYYPHKSIYLVVACMQDFFYKHVTDYHLTFADIINTFIAQLLQRFRTDEQIYTLKLIFNTLLTIAPPWYFGCSHD